jgi:hypothetical protein
MKVKFEKKGTDKILMTLSSGLQINIDMLEVKMIRDACNEFLSEKKVEQYVCDTYGFCEYISRKHNKETLRLIECYEKARKERVKQEFLEANSQKGE